MAHKQQGATVANRGSVTLTVFPASLVSRSRRTRFTPYDYQVLPPG